MLLRHLKCEKNCLPRAWESVTGQRSNQLNYVPSLFSWVCGKPLIFLSFLIVHSVACFIHFHPV